MINVVDNNFKRIVTYSKTVEDGDISAYADLSNTGTLGTFLGSTVAGIATHNNWELDVTVDGGSVNKLVDIDIAITDDWDAVALAIQTSLRTATSSTETVSIVDGVIRFQSATGDASSAMLVVAGTAGSGSGDLIAAITALSAGYTCTKDDPIAGQVAIELIDAPVDDYDGFLITSLLIKTSADVVKNDGLVNYYEADSDNVDYVYVQDGASIKVAVGDNITFSGFYYTT